MGFYLLSNPSIYIYIFLHCLCLFIPLSLCYDLYSSVDSVTVQLTLTFWGHGLHEKKYRTKTTFQLQRLSSEKTLLEQHTDSNNDSNSYKINYHYKISAEEYY